MSYEIQHETLCDGWINTWSDCQGNPLQFKTLRIAQDTLSDYLDDEPMEDRDAYRKVDLEDCQVYHIVPISKGG